MDQEKITGQPENGDWFDKMENPMGSENEIGTDEHAVASHDMSSLSDIEIDNIIRETLSEDWQLEESAEEAISNLDLDAALSSEYSDIFSESPEAEANSEPEAASDDVYSDADPEAEEEEPEDPDAVPRKVRPKRKSRYGLFAIPHLVSTCIWLIIAVVIGTSLGRLLWVCATDILAFGREDKEVVITITEEDDLDSITEKLHESGLIKYPSLFKFYAKLSQVEEKGKISTGTFTLNTLYDYHALVGGMSSSSSYRETIDVTIPEGYTCAQIFALMEERGVCSVEALEAYCIENNFESYWFLDGVEKGTAHCLEGFLYPNTYNFYTNSSAREVFRTFLNEFNNQFNEEMQLQLDALNETLAAMYRANGLSEAYIAEHRFTVVELVTVASMIEKETAYSGESALIASVIYNRLTNPSNYPHLDIDATVVYALGGKNDLTLEDLRVDSPYNTYVCEGLPVGPISNPGKWSLTAALNPAVTNYHFYALDTSGTSNVHRFFSTYAEHQAYLQSLE